MKLPSEPVGLVKYVAIDLFRPAYQYVVASTIIDHDTPLLQSADFCPPYL
jgi:hypothetical protein